MSRPILSTVVFFAVATAILGGMHYFLWARLVRDPALAEPWRRILTVALALAAVSVPAGMFAWRFLPSGLSRAASALLFTWLGASFLLFSALVAVEAVRWAGSAAAWLASLLREPGPPSDPSRRIFLARAAAASATLTAGGAAGLGFKTAISDPVVREVPVSLERLPAALAGFSIAQISDLHVGPTIGEKEVRRVVELTNAARPDAVVITGDLVDAPVAALRQATQHLANLKAPQGVYFVTGNHEYYAGAAPWLEELRRYGIRVLRNERVTLGDRGPGGASFDLAGVDDWSVARAEEGRWPALARAVEGRDPDRALVLLAHQPRGLSEAIRSGVELQLSGHTHGGQLFPWSLLVGAVFPYLKGLYHHAEAGRQGQIYVSCGTGYWGPPIRIGAPAEVARLVLTPGAPKVISRAR
ncbi:MAG: metallophosphoesterase [Deltaproteobacteria bacterium]|nr:metallophosphoesterase [Deltaproteobacteria bacterium]